MKKKKPSKAKKIKVDRKQVDYYMSLPYSILLTPMSEEDGGGWLAEIPVMKGCMTDSSTPTKAVKRVRIPQRMFIESYLDGGETVPLPDHPLLFNAEDKKGK